MGSPKDGVVDLRWWYVIDVFMARCPLPRGEGRIWWREDVSHHGKRYKAYWVVRSRPQMKRVKPDICLQQVISKRVR